MDLKFQIMYKNEITADVTITGHEVKVITYTDDRIKTCGFYNGIDLLGVAENMEMRCFPEDTANADELLKAMGLSSYNPFDIVKKTHGLMYNDFSWFRFEGEEISYEDIAIRK